jgi:hypothetical protein
LHPVEIGRQSGVHEEIGRPTAVAGVVDGQIPTGLIRLSEAVTVIERLNFALDEKMVMVVGVGGGVAGIAQQHLVGDTDGRVSWSDAKKQQE